MPECTRPRCSFDTDQLVCDQCISKTRNRIWELVELAALMPDEALELGSLDSAAFNLAGPSCDPEAFEHRQASAAAGRIAATDADPNAKRHPTYLLRWWTMTLSDVFIGDPPTSNLATDHAAYLADVLPQFAADEILGEDADHNIHAFHRDLGKAINHATVAIRDHAQPTAGINCPPCWATGNTTIRLKRSYRDDEDAWSCIWGHHYLNHEYVELVDTLTKEHA